MRVLRCLYLREGSSDDGIADHIERIGAEINCPVTASTPDFERLEKPPSGGILGKLQAARRLGGDEYELIAVHRDSDSAGRQQRYQEIESAIGDSSYSLPWAPVIPVRMTEAWLLLDEEAIRHVAGNPKGSMELSLPKAHEAESMADPKEKLKNVLAIASGLSGRKLKGLNNRFSKNRRLLLESLSPTGQVSTLTSWQQFNEDVIAALEAARNYIHN